MSFWQKLINFFTGKKTEKIPSKVEPLPKVNQPAAKSRPYKGEEPGWMTEAEKQKGSKETDPEYNKKMSKKWSLFGMNLGTIAQKWAAWCGLFVAVCLAAAGVKHQSDGALARNWGKYGQAIEWRTEGAPRGAIVWINHGFNCNSSSGNHVAFLGGDCVAEDLKPGKTFMLLGGNQGNMVKYSSYPTKEICGVAWPKESKWKYPGKITKSVNCAGGSASKESTR